MINYFFLFFTEKLFHSLVSRRSILQSKVTRLFDSGVIHELLHSLKIFKLLLIILKYVLLVLMIVSLF